MKAKYIIALLVVISWVGAYQASAQSPLSLYYLENVPQSTTINPAMVPRAKAFFGIPGINSIYAGLSTDLLGPDIIQKYNGGFVTLTQKGFDYAPFYKNIGKTANISIYETVSPLVFGFSGKRGYFTFGITEKFNQALAIPKDFFTIPDKGISAGDNFDFSTFGANAQYYREFSFGYSYKVMSQLRVGVHAKFLQGIAALKTDFDQFSMNVDYQDPTDPRHVEYDLNMDGTVYLSAPIDVETDDNNFPNGIADVDIDMDYILEHGMLNFSNPGVAIDIGAVYDYSPAWNFSASVNDLGFIKWTSNLTSFNANGTFNFNGVSIDNSNLDSLDNALDDLADSAKNALNVEQGAKSFTTGLGPKVYLGAKYNVNHYFSVGGLSRTVFERDNIKQEFNLSANLNLYHVLTATLNYTLAINGANNIGFGLALRGGPLQFYVAADYLPYAYRKISIVNTDDENSDGTPKEPTEVPYTPTRLDNFNIMLGLNLIFGANGYRDEPMIDAYNEF